MYSRTWKDIELFAQGTFKVLYMYFVCSKLVRDLFRVDHIFQKCYSSIYTAKILFRQKYGILRKLCALSIWVFADIRIFIYFHSDLKYMTDYLLDLK